MSGAALFLLNILKSPKFFLAGVVAYVDADGDLIVRLYLLWYVAHCGHVQPQISMHAPSAPSLAPGPAWAKSGARPSTCRPTRRCRHAPQLPAKLADVLLNNQLGLQTPRIDICAQQIIRTALPARPRGLECSQYVRIEANGGGHLGIGFHRADRAAPLARGNLLWCVHAAYSPRTAWPTLRNRAVSNSSTSGSLVLDIQLLLDGLQYIVSAVHSHC